MGTLYELRHTLLTPIQTCSELIDVVVILLTARSTSRESIQLSSSPPSDFCTHSLARQRCAPTSWGIIPELYSPRRPNPQGLTCSNYGCVCLHCHRPVGILESTKLSAHTKQHDSRIWPRKVQLAHPTLPLTHRTPRCTVPTHLISSANHDGESH